MEPSVVRVGLQHIGLVLLREGPLRERSTEGSMRGRLAGFLVEQCTTWRLHGKDFFQKLQGAVEGSVADHDEALQDLISMPGKCGCPSSRCH